MRSCRQSGCWLRPAWSPRRSPAAGGRVAVAGILGGLPVVAGRSSSCSRLSTVARRGGGGSGTLLGWRRDAFVVATERHRSESDPRRACSPAGQRSRQSRFCSCSTATRSLIGLRAACFAAGLALLPAPTAAPVVARRRPGGICPHGRLRPWHWSSDCTAASGALGPSLIGLLAPFPVITSALAVFTHVHGGLGQVRVLLRNFLVGVYGFAAFCFALTLCLDSLGGLAAISAALSAAPAGRGRRSSQ